MPPGQPPGSLGFLAPTVLPLPSAASGQDSPGGAISTQPHGRCTWDSPPQGACSLGRQGRGGRRRVRGLQEPRHPKLELCWGGGSPMQRGLQGCSASWGQSIFVQRLFLLLPLRCATSREKHLR